MGCVESNGGVHTEGAGTATATASFVNGSWTRFVTATGMERNCVKYKHICILPLLLPLLSPSPNVNTQIGFHITHLVSVAIENVLLMNTCNDAIAIAITQCEQTYRWYSILTLIMPANYFQPSIKYHKAQKCLYLTLSIQCHMQLKLLISLTAV